MCGDYCLKGQRVSDGNELWDTQEVVDKAADRELLCGRNCIRKFDKTYKMFDNVEGKIL